MRLKHLALTYFRNYTRLEIDLPARISVFRGDNAQGKTNLLEAIYYLATTKSPLASSDRQLINWDADREVIPYARLEGLFTRSGEDHTIEMTLVEEPRSNDRGGATAFRRQIRLDGVSRRAFDTVGELRVVLFLPEDLCLATGSPGDRRRFLDITLCQMDRLYCRSLSRYNRVLRQRNALLRQVAAGHAHSAELAYWDEQLSGLGARLLSRRLWATSELDRHAREIHLGLTGGQERLELRYQSSVATKSSPRESPPEEGEHPELSAGVAAGGPGLEGQFLGALRAVRGEEMARAVTVVGPHRDDLRFLIDGRDATVFGSRGQQRTVVVALKLAEVELMTRQAGETPLLLLDDVVSELDRHRAGFLLDNLSRSGQALITTTDAGCFSSAFLSSVALWHIMDGAIVPCDSTLSTGL